MEIQAKVTFRGVQGEVQREKDREGEEEFREINLDRSVGRERVSEKRVERGGVQRGTLDLLTRLGYLRTRSGY